MTYTHPPRADLRRIHPLVDVPAAIKGASLERTAHHEAAHIVMMEWCGLTPTQATASAGRGSAEFDTTELDADEPAADHDGPLAAAQIAAIYHAGILAELIYTGHRWQGVTIRMASQDWKMARTILAPHFGAGLARHGFAQRTALAVLTKQWPRVQEIAAHLIEHGTWSPDDARAIA
ncbi:MAG TPA: hypothetical protein DCL01_01365 [Thauera sp.]|nr:hypothetical protein [Thauera sp.]HHW65767.1 hypothetical protein [Rhodocyclaceae bacterium]